MQSILSLIVCVAAILLSACAGQFQSTTLLGGAKHTAFAGSLLQKSAKDDWATEFNPTGQSKSSRKTTDADQTAVVKAYTNTKLAGFAKDSWLGGKNIDRAAAGDALKAGTAAKQIDATKAVELKKLDLLEPVTAAP